ncbi:MAG: hypothetical protein QNJ09_13145 [Paracoccaceae bacterium]|nr:hypothetical protein [Paracoccaceae bacterium]
MIGFAENLQNENLLLSTPLGISRDGGAAPDVVAQIMMKSLHSSEGR